MHQFEVGGCESVFIELSKLINNEIELVTTTPHLNQKLLQQLPDHVKIIQHKDIPVLSWLHKIKILQRKNLLYSLVSMMIIPIFLKKRNKTTNTKYINFSDTLSSLYISVKASRGKGISWLHCRPMALFKSKFLSKYIKYLQKCEKIVFICNSQRKEFLETFKWVHTSNTEVIYNPIDINKIAVKQQEEISFDKPYICMVSRLDERSKDFHTPIEAFEKLPQNLKDKYTLQIIGDGPDKGELQQFIDEKGLHEKIILQGADINPYKWMKNAELFLFSSKSEGLGMVILEAMACTVPVIATDCPVGPAEILKESEDSGLLVKVGDAEEMSEILRQTLVGEIDTDKYVNNAKKRVLDFSTSKFKQKINVLFNTDK